MTLRHIALALLVAVIWGVNFVVIRVGLDSFPPLLLAALRFLVCATAVCFVKRPDVSWIRLVVTGTFLFTGQFALLFSGMKAGMPPGLASITVQAQAFFTILIALLILRERPSGRQVVGTLVAFAGLAVILSTAGVDASLIGMLLCLTGSVSWAAGNVLLRGAGRIDMFAMMVWLSLIPPLPLLALSFAIEGKDAISTALAHAGLGAVGVVLYLAVLSTIVGYGLWGHLLKLYPAAVVAPFSMLVPIFGALSASLLLGEHFGPFRLAGTGLVLAGLAVVALPVARLRDGWGRIVAGIRVQFSD